MAVTFSACANSERDLGLRPTRVDSAGVEIVTIPSSPWSAAVWATIDTAGALRIVPDAARPETLFGRIRGALRVPGDRIAVLDIGRHSVQLFAGDGSFVRTIGREGQGPGELESPWRLVRARGDSVGVYDLAGHLELLALSGEGSRRARVPPTAEGGMAQVLGAFENGDYLAIVNEFPGPPQPGTIPLFSTLKVMSASGDTGLTLGRHQSTQFTFRKFGDELRQVQTLFWAEPGMGVLDAGYVWCLVTEFECQIRSRTGSHVRTIRAPVETAAVTQRDVDEYMRLGLSYARTANDSIRERRTVSEAERMERFPVLSLIRTDARGRIWIRPYIWREADRQRPWIVLDGSGAVLGSIALPWDMQVFDIGDDYVLGTERDDDDAEEVVMYRYEVRR